MHIATPSSAWQGHYYNVSSSESWTSDRLAVPDNVGVNAPCRQTSVAKLFCTVRETSSRAGRARRQQCGGEGAAQVAQPAGMRGRVQEAIRFTDIAPRARHRYAGAFADRPLRL